MQSAKEPFIENDPELVAEALSKLLDSRNYPILVHSNKGKHRWFSLPTKLHIDKQWGSDRLSPKTSGMEFSSNLQRIRPLRSRKRRRRSTSSSPLPLHHISQVNFTSSLKISMQILSMIPSISHLGCHESLFFFCNYICMMYDVCIYNLMQC